MMDSKSGSAVATLLGQPRFSSTRLEDVGDYVRTFSKPFVLARPPTHLLHFSFSHARRQLPHLCLDFVNADFDSSFLISGPKLEDRYLVQIPFTGHCTVEQNGERFTVGEGSAFVINPFTASRKFWEGGCRQLMIWIERQALERVLIDELGYGLDRPLEFLRERDARPSGLTWFTRNLVDIAAHVGKLEGAEVHWRYIRQLERSLLVNLLTALPHTYRGQLDRTEHQIAPYYVRRVETFFRQYFADPITMHDILRVAGTSARALFYGFRNYRATTPMMYLKQLRLHEARTRLLRAADTGGCVTEIALACGFSHLSMFTRDYRRRYGETPSQTLKRGVS